MTTKQNIFKVILLMIGTFLGAGLTFITQLILANNLTLSEYGIFAANFALITLLAPLAVFGIPQLWLKHFGHYGFNGTNIIKPSIRFIFFTILLVFTIILLIATISNDSILSKTVMIILSFYILGQLSLEVISSKLQLEEKFEKLAYWQMSQHLFRFILIVALLYLYRESFNVVNIAFIYSIVAIIFFIIGLILLLKMANGYFDLKGHNKTIIKTNAGNIFQQSWPFALSTFFYLIYFQSDLIMIKLFIGDESAGLYNAAFTILVAILLIPNVIYQKFLMPKIHRWANHDTVQLHKIYKQGQIIMITTSIIIMTILLFFSDLIITTLFSKSFSEAILILNVLLLSIPLVFIAHNSGTLLTTKNLIYKKVTYMGIVALINIILNLLIIPKYGTIGAAWTTFFSNIILMSLYLYGVNKYLLKVSKIEH